MALSFAINKCGSGRSPGGQHGNSLQYSCLENPREQRSLAGYSPRGHKESHVTDLTHATSVYSLVKRVKIRYLLRRFIVVLEGDNTSKILSTVPGTIYTLRSVLLFIYGR